MQLLFDNLTAILVASVVLLILAVIHLTTQSASADSGFYYMNRVQTLALVEMVERDFPNIGAGVDPQQEAMLVDYSWKGKKARHFTFRATLDTSAAAPVELIRYAVEPVDNAACDAAAIQCFEVQRLVHDGTTFVTTGRSNAFVTKFEIELHPHPSSLESVREVEVRLASLSPGGPQNTIQQSRWGTRYRPFSLTLQAAASGSSP